MTFLHCLSHSFNTNEKALKTFMGQRGPRTMLKARSLRGYHIQPFSMYDTEEDEVCSIPKLASMVHGAGEWVWGETGVYTNASHLSQHVLRHMFWGMKLPPLSM